MNFRDPFMVPAFRLAVIFLLTAGCVAAAIALSSAQLATEFELRAGQTLESSEGSMILEEFDLLDEPGELESYEKLNRFFARQDEMHKITAGENLTVLESGNRIPLTAAPRGWQKLPALFWIQVVVAAGGLLISGWIWALKPRNAATIFFLLSGISMGLSALTSAVYTTRTLAIPSTLFLPLETVNEWGASAFGMSMIALFLIYPVRLAYAKRLIVFEFLAFLIWTLAYSRQWSPEWAGINTIIVTMMALICVCICVQFICTRKDPRARASLLWLGLSVVIGAGSFVGANTVPILLNIKPLNQGYAFLSFLVIYLGLAAGLRQFRLFEVGEWGFRFLFYACGALLFFLFDAAFIFIVKLERFAALELGLILVGLCYLPLRHFFWAKLSNRNELQSHELLTEAMHVAFASSAAQRSQRWEDLLRRLFRPLHIDQAPEAVENARIENDGLELLLPAVADIPALKLSYPHSGRALFSPRNRDTAAQLITFIAQAESSREAYDRGVSEERLRMAQDLHDDLGARLLSGLHSADEKNRPSFAAALDEMRMIVSELAREEALLNALLADARFEAQRRLSAAGIALEWSLDEDHRILLSYQEQKAVRSSLREAVNNVIHHSGATRMTIGVKVEAGLLVLSTQDDGRGFSLELLERADGYGLKSLRRRTLNLGGQIEFDPRPGACTLRIQIPLRHS